MMCFRILTVVADCWAVDLGLGYFKSVFWLGFGIDGHSVWDCGCRWVKVRLLELWRLLSLVLAGPLDADLGRVAKIAGTEDGSLSWCLVWEIGSQRRYPVHSSS